MADAATVDDVRVTSEVRDSVLVVTLNDPKTRNALGAIMAGQLNDAIKARGPEIRVIVIRGEGDAFSSGANLSEDMASMSDPNRDLGHHLDTDYKPLFDTLRSIHTPVVTAIDGPCAGIGFSLALMGDLIVASERAWFAQGFNQLSLVPDGGATWILPRTIGRPLAMRLYLLGERLTAQEAQSWGLLTHLLPEAGFEDAVMGLAVQAASAPPLGVKATRQAYQASFDNTFDSQWALERELQRDLGRTDDFVEGVMAFLEKRSAQFKGR